jgi:acyl-coenzyme A synthetase/AMP-(fatty) acid ligase
MRAADAFRPRRLPDDVIFVKTLPMTASGEIRKAELRDAIVAGAYGHLALPEVSIGGTGN